MLLVAGAIVLASYDPGQRSLRTQNVVSSKRRLGPVPTGTQASQARRRRSIHGIVSEIETGKPIAGAAVTLFALGGKGLAHGTFDLRGMGKEFASVRTGPDGKFLFHAATADHAVVQAKAKGFVPVRCVAEMGSREDLELELGHGAGIAIHVLDRDGRAIPSAEAFLIPDDGGQPCPPIQFAADPDGVIRFLHSPRSPIFVRAPGYAGASLWPEGETEMEVRLEREFQLAGRVVGGDGHPIPGSLLILGYSSDVEWGRRADAEGRFRFTGLSAGEQALRVTASGYSPYDELVGSGDVDLRIVLHRPCALCGRAILPDGAPAKGARVKVTHYADVLGTCVTGATGEFECPDLAPGEVSLEVCWGDKGLGPVPPFYAQLQATIPSAALKVRLHRISYLHVCFVGGRGRPQTGWGIWKPFPIDASGNARKAEILAAVDEPPGDEILVTAMQNTGGVREFRFRAPLFDSAAEAATAVRVPPPVRMTLVVRGPEGASLPVGVHSSITPNAQIRIDPEAAREDNRFQLLLDPGLPSFVPNLSITAPGYVPVHRVLGPLREGTTVEVDLRKGGVLRGRLVGADGTPVREGYVYAPSQEPVGSGLQGDDGSFVVQGIPPGERDFFAGYSSQRAAWHEKLNVRDGDVVDLGDVVLKPPSELTGTVLDSAGEPLGGVRVTTDGDLHDGSGDDRTTHDDGSYRIEEAAFLSGRLVFSKPGFGMKSLPFAAGPSREVAPVVLPPEGALLVSVVAAAPGQDDWQLGVGEPGGSWSWWPNPTCEPDGYRIRGLPPGRLVVFLVDTKTHARLAQQTVEIEAGKVTTAEMTLPPK